MLEAKFDDFKEDINTTKTYIAKKYGYLIKNISPQMAAIQKYFPKYRVFKKFHEEVALNFFKYKEYLYHPLSQCFEYCILHSLAP